MALNDTIASGIATANKITASLQDTVGFEAWTGKDKFAKPTYAASVNYQALIERKQTLRRKMSGEEVAAQTKITIIGPVANTVATSRHNPIDPRDRITLPDGTIGPIVDVQGLVNPGTSEPYMVEVFLGGTGTKS
jgi:hypothetical protein